MKAKKIKEFYDRRRLSGLHLKLTDFQLYRENRKLLSQLKRPIIALSYEQIRKCFDNQWRKLEQSRTQERL